MVKGVAGWSCKSRLPWQQKHTRQCRRRPLVGRPGRSGWLSLKTILWVFLIINSSQWAAASKISHLQQLHGRSDPGATPEPAHLLQQLHPGTPGTLYTATKPWTFKWCVNKSTFILQLRSSQDSVWCNSMSSKNSVTYSNTILTKPSQSFPLVLQLIATCINT